MKFKNGLVFTAAMAFGSAQAAGIYLPTIGVDGWFHDELEPYNNATSQGFLTLSNGQDHVVNPAHMLALDETVEVVTYGGGLDGGIFTEQFGQKLGLYLGRLNANPLDGADINDDGTEDFLSNIADVYWGKELSSGALGVRFNFQALSYNHEDSLDDDTVSDDSVTNKGRAYNITLGYLSEDGPFEATATIGLPTGSMETVFANDTNTNKIEGEIDAGLRLGLAGKYVFDLKSGDRSSVAAYFGSAKANYGFKETNTNPAGTVVDGISRDENTAFGLVLSHEKFYGERTRLVSSIGWQRQTNLSEIEDKLANVTNTTETTLNIVPVAFSIEFSKSEKTTIFASVSSDLYNSSRVVNSVKTAAVDTNVDDTVNAWDDPGADAEFGVRYKFTDRTEVDILIDPAILTGGLDEGFATFAKFTHKL